MPSDIDTSGTECVAANTEGRLATMFAADIILGRHAGTTGPLQQQHPDASDLQV